MTDQEKQWTEDYRQLVAQFSGITGVIPGDIQSDPITYKIYMAARKQQYDEDMKAIKSLQNSCESLLGTLERFAEQLPSPRIKA